MAILLTSRSFQLSARVLILAALFHPFEVGGAEMSARRFGQWLRSQGHTVGVLTTAPTLDDEVWGVIEDGLTVFRTHMPRPFSMFDRSPKSAARKARWHFLDHFAPFNRRLARRVIADFVPDIVSANVVQGLGHNMIAEFGRAGLPVVYTQHDLGLACINQFRFRNGRECTGHCAPCRASTIVKRRQLATVDRLSLISPSRANLETLGEFTPITELPGYAIPNANHYPEPAQPRVPSDVTRLLFVGRLASSKGVDVAIEALRPLTERHRFTLTVLGSGPDEAMLHEMAQNLHWVNFGGHVSVAEVSEAMNQADLLLVPSTWRENSPGVVLQAHAIGLPVLASRTGGIPELIEEGVDGLLVAPGDVDRWRAELDRLLGNPDEISRLRSNVVAAIPGRQPERRAQQIWEVFKGTREPGTQMPSIGPKERVFPRA